MNLPNMLTMSRFFLIPLFIVVFFKWGAAYAFLIFVIAGITDVADGYIARKRNLVTDLGKMLDPLADKLMILTVIISLLLAGKLTWLVTLLVCVREGAMIASSIYYHFHGKKTVPANLLGKLTTLLFYVAILLIVFEISYYVQFLWLVVTLSFIASVKYFYEFRILNNTSTGTKKPSYSKRATVSDE